MNESATGNVRLYIRFHKDIDVMIEAFCKDTGMKRATAISFILNSYVLKLESKQKDIVDIVTDDLDFCDEGEAYYMQIGRSDMGRVAGKRTLITLSKETDRKLKYIAIKLGFSLSQFRTQIIVRYFTK